MYKVSILYITAKQSCAAQMQMIEYMEKVLNHMATSKNMKNIDFHFYPERKPIHIYLIS